MRWRSVDGARPDAATITLEGTPLEVADLDRVELPAYDPDRIHLLKAELRFGLSLAYAEFLIGGEVSAAIGSDLTALPVLRADRRRPPTAEEMTGWLERAGRPLQVAAVDLGPADRILGPDQSPRVLAQLERRRREALGQSPSTRQPSPGPVGVQHGDRLRVIDPQALPVARPAVGRGGESAASGPGDDATPKELFPLHAQRIRLGSEDAGRGAR